MKKLSISFSFLFILFFLNSYAQVANETDDLIVANKSNKKTNLTKFLDAKKWNVLFPNRFNISKYPDSSFASMTKKDFYSFSAFVAAAKLFPIFLGDGNNSVQRRELAAFLANISHETNGGWDNAPGGINKWGLYFVQENGFPNTKFNYADNTNKKWEPVADPNKTPLSESPWYPEWLKSLFKERPYDPRVWITKQLHSAVLTTEFAHKPIVEQASGLDEFEKYHKQQLGVRLRVIGNFAHSSWRVNAQMATTRTAIALERYRQAKGQWPATLDQLVPGFLAEVPTDVYTGKPLLYRREDRGVVVYSVGPDRVDNNGKLGRFISDGTDIGVRLWDPEHRRQAPLPAISPRSFREDGP